MGNRRIISRVSLITIEEILDNVATGVYFVT